MNNPTDEQRFLQLQSLPINDLQTLLTFAGQSRTGKRHELIDRCHGLMKASKIIREKCEELHNKRFGHGELPTIPYPKDATNTTRPNHHHPHSHQQSNLDINFAPFTFNEDLCTISPPHTVAAAKQAANASQPPVNFYFLLTAQQASGRGERSVLHSSAEEETGSNVLFFCFIIRCGDLDLFQCGSIKD